MQIQGVAIINDLKLLSTPEKSVLAQRYFKTGKGQYAEGDIFWGISVPNVRRVAKKYYDLSVEELDKLLENEVHEVRLCVLLIMVFQAQNKSQAMFDLYLKKARFVNNWDLVDLSAPQIVGNFLLGRDCAVLYVLAQSSSLWERRIAIVATFAFIKKEISDHTCNLAKVLMNDHHDLIHKAVGWMLREVGKRCSVTILENFLEEHAARMPRTMLRYAIERLSPGRRWYFMSKKLLTYDFSGR